tara:strand:- start:315 stop:728 length:414 start_codon:yes stop_codon:yes gene_type:complete
MKCQLVSKDTQHKRLNNYTHVDVDNLEVKTIPNHSAEQFIVDHVLCHVEPNKMQETIAYVATKLRKGGQAVFSDTELTSLCKTTFERKKKIDFNSFILGKKNLHRFDMTMNILKGCGMTVLSSSLEEETYTIVVTKS